MNSNKKTITIFDGDKINVKIKISVLWLLWIVTDLAAGMLWLIEPGVLDEIRSGEIFGMIIGNDLLLLGTVLYLIPLIMSFVSLAIKNTINRWTNLILGVVYMLYGLTNIIEQVAEPSIYRTPLTILMFVFSALIVLHAWKWPKQENQS